MTHEEKKIFVLDTNVILHDCTCIYHFEKNDIVVPITVIEELDGFKKGKEIINCNAREFLRTLDALTGEKLFNGGVPIGNGCGRICVRLEGDLHKDLKNIFGMDKPDHRILNLTYWMAKANSFSQVVLVTKDVNLRMKAKSLGLLAEDYTCDHVKNISEIYKGSRVIEGMSASLIQQLYVHPCEINAEKIDLKTYLIPEELCANEYLILRNGSLSALGVYDKEIGKIKRIEKRECFGIWPRNAEQSFALNALLNRDISLVTLTGKAGTGKTLLALAAALEYKRYYRQIFIARPVVPLSNKDIGYLPGDIYSKLDPYMQPLFDNLSVIQSHISSTGGSLRTIKNLLDEEKIVVTPLSYIRGRSLVKTFFIVDEAQNLTPHEVKTIITRAGEGTKIVFTGDIFQIDHPYLDAQSNGLSYVIEKMKGQQLYAHINLEKGERSELSNLAIQLL